MNKSPSATCIFLNSVSAPRPQHIRFRSFELWGNLLSRSLVFAELDIVEAVCVMITIIGFESLGAGQLDKEFLVRGYFRHLGAFADPIGVVVLLLQCLESLLETCVVEVVEILVFFFVLVPLHLNELGHSELLELLLLFLSVPDVEELVSRLGGFTFDGFGIGVAVDYRFFTFGFFVSLGIFVVDVLLMLEKIGKAS